ncbi:MAG: hypothetical protein AAGH15_20285 [Myxococcota bacterium]
MAKAKAKAKAKAPPPVEELYFRSDSAYLCLILNRRTDFVRVIDFRAGALPAKRLFIQSVAQKEGVAKVITLVEKDEVSSWTKVGFVREGTIPGFYKRSDGHLCGCVIGDKTASVEVDDKAVKLADRIINRAKKAATDFPETIKGASVGEVTEAAANKARDQVWRKGHGLGSFDAFGRDAARFYFEASYKKAPKNYVSAEFQDCFGHSLIEVLRAPETEDDIKCLVAGLRHAGNVLQERGIVSAFSFGPIDHELLATAFVAAGYRKTGLLAKGVKFQGERQDAVLWSRKLASATGEDND